MDFIEKLKEKQKDQSAKNWFDLGVKTKSMEKKVKYFTKCLLIEPENVQALRLMADAQMELGLIDASKGSIARADELEGITDSSSQNDVPSNEDSSFESVNFVSNSNFSSSFDETSDADNTNVVDEVSETNDAGVAEDTNDLVEAAEAVEVTEISNVVEEVNEVEDNSGPIGSDTSAISDVSTIADTPMAGLSADETVPVDDGVEIIKDKEEESNKNKWSAFEEAKKKEPAKVVQPSLASEDASNVPAFPSSGVAKKRDHPIKMSEHSLSSDSVKVAEKPSIDNTSRSTGTNVPVMKDKTGEPSARVAKIEEPAVKENIPKMTEHKHESKVQVQDHHIKTDASVPNHSFSTGVVNHGSAPVTSSVPYMGEAADVAPVADVAPITIPMKEIIKFWAVGIVAILIAGLILSKLTV